MKLTVAEVAGCSATLAVWILAAVITDRLEPALGGELSGMLLLVAALVGIWLYGPVSERVRIWQTTRKNS